MSNRKNTFTYQGQTFCETLYKDGQKNRSRVFLVVPEKGRYLQTGDVDSQADPSNTPLSTSYLVTGEAIRDYTARNAATQRLLDKAAPWFEKAARKPLTMKDIFNQNINAFLADTAKRPERSRRWNEETQKKNLSLYRRELWDPYSEIMLPLQPGDRAKLESRLEENTESDEMYNTCVNLNNQFMEYLESHTELDLTPLLHLKSKMISPEEKFKKRMMTPRSLPPALRGELLAFLLTQINNQTPLAGVALGMLVMFCMGLRSSEMLARTLGDLCQNICYIGTQKKGQRRVQTLKRDNSYRKLPVVSLLRQAADGQVAALCRRLGISRETALGYPVTGAEQDEARMMEQADFAAKAREIFLALGVQEEALQAYSGLMDEMKGDGAEQEVNVCAYILRRDYITRLYNHTALSQQMISYLAGHAQADQKPYRPNDAELAAARLALEQAFSAAPCADGAAPVTVCCSVHTLAPGEILQITAAERGDPMAVTITGEPGTAVDVVLAQRLDPPEDAPVCRNTIHV